jgi:hypothetical protein
MRSDFYVPFQLPGDTMLHVVVPATAGDLVPAIVELATNAGGVADLGDLADELADLAVGSGFTVRYANDGDGRSLRAVLTPSG